MSQNIKALTGTEDLVAKAIKESTSKTSTSSTSSTKSSQSIETTETVELSNSNSSKPEVEVVSEASDVAEYKHIRYGDRETEYYYSIDPATGEKTLVSKREIKYFSNTSKEMAEVDVYDAEGNLIEYTRSRHNDNGDTVTYTRTGDEEKGYTVNSDGNIIQKWEIDYVPGTDEYEKQVTIDYDTSDSSHQGEMVRRIERSGDHEHGNTYNQDGPVGGEEWEAEYFPGTDTVRRQTIKQYEPGGTVVATTTYVYNETGDAILKDGPLTGPYSHPYGSPNAHNPVPDIDPFARSD